MKNLAEELITAERKRQIEKEGWTIQHDDTHAYGELAKAASTYMQHAAGNHQVPQGFAWARAHGWPWSSRYWKPSTPERDLIKAGALLAAEMERVLRLPDYYGEAKAQMLVCMKVLNRMKTEV
jgi:hypothetical protein